MKKRMISIALILLLVFALCACGSMRVSDDPSYSRDRTGTDYSANDDSRTENGRNDNGIIDDKQMMPDYEDGVVRDNQSGNGVINGNMTMPSPNVSPAR